MSASIIQTTSSLLQAHSDTLGQDGIYPLHIQGSEKISSPYHFQIHCVIPNDVQWDIPSLLSTSLAIQICHTVQASQYIHGRITSATKLNSPGHVQLQLSPWISLLTQTKDCRIFQDQTIPDIVTTVFKDRGFNDFDFSGLLNTYPTLPYIVQFNETDYDFITRCLAQAGIYFYFSHESNKHIFHAIDCDYKTPLIPDIIYDNKNTPAEPHITRWETTNKLGVQSITQSDYDPQATHANLKTSATATATQSPTLSELKHYHYPGGYTNSIEGSKSTQIYLNAINASTKTIYAESDCDQLHAGYRIKLKNREDNANFLITELNIDAKDQSSLLNIKNPEKYYRNNFISCIDSQNYQSTIFPKPKIMSLQTATVVGPSDQEIYIDEQGKVKVQFHWDQYGSNNQNSSCWLRASQAQAGAEWGSFFVPRIGQEVLVAFLDGDPEKPIIIGSAYNSSNNPAYSLPEDQYTSGIKTKTPNEAGSGNELTFSDNQGTEQIVIKATKDYTQSVQKNTEQIIKGNTRTTIETGSHSTQITEGGSSTTAATKLTFQVKQSSFIITPSDLTITAPKVDINPTLIANATSANDSIVQQAILDSLNIFSLIEV